MRVIQRHSECARRCAQRAARFARLNVHAMSTACRAVLRAPRACVLACQMRESCQMRVMRDARARPAAVRVKQACLPPCAER